MRFRFVPFLLLLLWPLVGVAKDPDMIVGTARVIDGDTLDVAGVRIRLFGVDAVEKSQKCKARSGLEWQCGEWVTQQLADRLRGVTLRCQALELDKYGRTVARCFAGQTDISQQLVQLGQGFAYRKYSRAYVADEAQAVAHNRGLWQNQVQLPSDYRAARASQSVAPDPACGIKGNISKSGHIYHLEGQRYYAQTGINTARGERWFCSEAEAIAAGWRRAKI